MKDAREKRWMLWSLVICMGILFGSMLPVSAQDAVPPQGNRAVASLAIVDVKGDVEILSKIDAERNRGESRILADAWKPAIPRTPLSAGDQIRTGARGSLQLQLSDGTLVNLAGDTVAVVEELRSSRGESPQMTQIKLEQGRLTTQQSTKILGQTNQIIRTDNGTINTSLGEIEVWKPSSELPKIAAVGEFQLLAKAPKNETYMNLSRGGATVTSSGDGKIIASSMTTPETCIDEDGVRFTLADPNAAVTITKLEDENAYVLTSSKQFYVMVATEGTANSVDIITMDSDALIDIEGITVAEQKNDGASQVKLHELLTVGVKTFKVKIKLNCDDATPRGLNQFEVLGDAIVIRDSFGLDTAPPLPSGTSGTGIIPSIPPSVLDTSLSVEFGPDDITCGSKIDVPLTVTNTGEQSNAENVEISIQVISGSEYITSLSMTTWNVGTIPPGAFNSTVIRIVTNDIWDMAEEGAKIKLEATVTGETSRPDHTIGKGDTVTVINPGECDVKPEETPEETPEEQPSTPPGPPMPPIIIPGPLTQTDPTWGTHNLIMGATSAITPPINGTVSCGNGGTCGVNETCSTVSFEWSTDPANINGGALYLFHEPAFPAIGCTNPIASRYIVNQTPGDTVRVDHNGAGTITFTFCYPFFQQSQNFSVRVVDKIVGDVSPCNINGAFTVFPNP